MPDEDPLTAADYNVLLDGGSDEDCLRLTLLEALARGVLRITEPRIGQGRRTRGSVVMVHAGPRANAVLPRHLRRVADAVRREPLADLDDLADALTGRTSRIGLTEVVLARLEERRLVRREDIRGATTGVELTKRGRKQVHRVRRRVSAARVRVERSILFADGEPAGVGSVLAEFGSCAAVILCDEHLLATLHTLRCDEIAAGHHGRPHPGTASPPVSPLVADLVAGIQTLSPAVVAAVATAARSAVRARDSVVA